MGEPITVRPMGLDDVDAIVAIDRAVGWAHPEALVRFLLDDAETRGLVAEVQGAAVGFAFVGVREPVGWLGSLAVVPAQEGCGVGWALCRAADDYFRTAENCDVAILEVLATNRRAIDLYDRLGFVVTSVIEFCGTSRGEATVAPAATPGTAAVGRAITPLVEGDLPFLATLDDSYYGGWRERDLFLWLSEGFAAARLLRVDGQPVGYCLVEEATGRIGPAAAPTLPDLLALLDATIAALPGTPDDAPYAPFLRIVNPGAEALTALAARNLPLVPALRNLRMEKVYRRPLRQMSGLYLSARPLKG